jgi:hypothetical protein
MITTVKAIESLQSRLEALKSIHDSQRFNEWRISTLATLAHIFGESHSHYKALEKIYGFHYSDRTNSAKSEATELLNGLIENLKNFGFPKENENPNNGVVVSVSQSNQQSQSTQVNISFEFFIEILRGELRTSEIEELKEILQSSLEPKEKKKTFVDKIKSFGSDVASNILANLLTNPEVYNQLGRML